MIKMEVTQKTVDNILEQIRSRIAESQEDLQAAVDEINETSADNDKPKLKMSFGIELSMKEDGGMYVGSNIAFVVRRCKIKDVVLYPAEDGQLRIEDVFCKAQGMADEDQDLSGKIAEVTFHSGDKVVSLTRKAA